MKSYVKHTSVMCTPQRKNTCKNKPKQTNKQKTTQNTKSTKQWHPNLLFKKLYILYISFLCEIMAMVFLWKNVYFKTDWIRTPWDNILCVLRSYAEFSVQACPVMTIPPSGRLMRFVQSWTMVVCSTSHRQPLERDVDGASVARRWKGWPTRKTNFYVHAY